MKIFIFRAVFKNNMMKIAWTFLLFPVFSFAQPAIRPLLDTLLLRAQESSLYAGQVNWEQLREEVYRKAEGANSISELKPAFTALLNGLGDKHGRVLSARDYSTLAQFTDYEKLNHPDKRPRDPEMWRAVNDPSHVFESKVLSGKIGYLKIVGIPPNMDIAQEAQKIRNALTELADLKIDKWIIDLRYNGGGNMHPMVAGIAPLIGDGIVGSLQNLDGQKLFDWEIKSSNFIYAGYQAVQLPRQPVFKRVPKIAVLLSRWTVSSGEIVATCLKGRPNTRFFGEASGSLTTNNNWELIGGELILNISTGIFCDRNGIRYDYNIPVDVEIPFAIVKDPETDEGIQAAMKWLMEKR